MGRTRESLLSQGPIKGFFPFDEDPVALWNKVPKLDAAFCQFSRSTDLSLEDMGILKDPMDKRMDQQLKRAWQSQTHDGNYLPL